MYQILLSSSRTTFQLVSSKKELIFIQISLADVKRMYTSEEFDCCCFYLIDSIEIFTDAILSSRWENVTIPAETGFQRFVEIRGGGTLNFNFNFN